MNLMKSNPEMEIGPLLTARGWRLAVGESCTGGLISHRITNVPGSSDYFLGGVTSYANEAKQAWLEVREDTLQSAGAVSGETVLEMARGVRVSLRGFFPVASILGMAVSGIAGPAGGSAEKPVGLVWIGLSAADGNWAWKLQFNGGRLDIKNRSADESLVILLEYLQHGYPRPGWDLADHD
jgi:PncC family amidohydrolase